MKFKLQSQDSQFKVAGVFSLLTFWPIKWEPCLKPFRVLTLEIHLLLTLSREKQTADQCSTCLKYDQFVSYYINEK